MQLVISSLLLLLNDPDAPTLFHCFSGSRFSPDISLAPSSLAFTCFWEVFQDLGSDHLPILLTVHLFPLFHPDERPSLYNFWKARWDDFTFYFDSHCPSTEECPSLTLSSAAALFSSLTLNAAEFFIPSGRIKRQHQDWWSDDMEEAALKPLKDVRLLLPFIEVMKLHRLKTPLLDLPRLSSPKPRLRQGRQHTHLSLLNLT